MQLVNLMAAGSVDDGKSTLIGRLLYDSGSLPEDFVSNMRDESGRLDFANATDGLREERARRITIDVAHRTFATGSNRFLIADAPGHTEYLSNMATAASTADIALILVDVRQGLSEQSLRHAYLARLFGATKIILAVNKMDLVAYDQEAFERIVSSFRRFAAVDEVCDFTAIPVSALTGENVFCLAESMPWYDGPTLIEQLNAFSLPQRHAPCRFAVQLVLRGPNGELNYAGRVLSGVLFTGMPIGINSSGEVAYVQEIVDSNQIRVSSATAPYSVTVKLAERQDQGAPAEPGGGRIESFGVRPGAGGTREKSGSVVRSCRRGDVLSCLCHPLHGGTNFGATILWLGDIDLVANSAFKLKLLHRLEPVRITAVKSRVRLSDAQQTETDYLRTNDIGDVSFVTSSTIACDDYSTCRQTGGFILIDERNETIGAGMLQLSAAIRHHRPCWSR